MNRLEGDMHLAGTFTANRITLPAGTVTDSAVGAGAGIGTSKMNHRHQPAHAQDSATTAAAHARVVHVVRGATGTIVAFGAGLVAACTGNATVTVDLLKNGVSVLAAAITIDSGDAARAVVAGAISTAAVVAGDVLEVSVTVDAGTGALGTGLFASLTVDEAAA